MRQERKGHLAHKLTALLLVLVMALALPVIVQAADEASEDAIRLEIRTMFGGRSELFVYGATGTGTMDTDGIDGLSDIIRRVFPNIIVLYADVSTNLYLSHPDMVTGMATLILDLHIISPSDSNMTMFCANDCGWYATLNPAPNRYRHSISIGQTCFLGENASDAPVMFYIPLTAPGTFVFYNDFVPYMFAVVVEGATTTDPQPDAPTTAPNLSTASSWAHESINNAFVHGLIPQTLQSQYTQATTRAEFASIAVALYETVTGREITERMQFNDTTNLDVQKMGGLGVVMGVGDGNFAPNRTITRQEAAVLLARLAYAIGQPLPASAPTFADNASIAEWAVDGVGQMQAAGIMGGVGDNTFAPSGTYTREQSIVATLRLFDLLES